MYDHVTTSYTCICILYIVSVTITACASPKLHSNTTATVCRGGRAYTYVHVCVLVDSRNSISDWVVGADDIDERGEERKDMSVLWRYKVRQPPIVTPRLCRKKKQ